MTSPWAQAGRERAEAERGGGRKGTIVAHCGEGGPPADKEETERGGALGGKKGPTSVLQSKKERNG